MNLSDAARFYAERKFKVFPVVPGGKRPLTDKGFHDASDDVEQIQDWWNRYPNANIGFPVPERLVIVDVDSQEALHQLSAQDLSLPSTTTVKTPRGHHFWYKANGTKLRPAVDLFPGVDIRANGSYVILPPSYRPAEGKYTWKVKPDNGNIADVPEWIEEFAGKDHEEREGLYARDDGLDPDEILAGVPEGCRDVTLFRYACRLRGEGRSRQETNTLITAAAKASGFPIADAMRKITQAWKYPPGGMSPEEIEQKSIKIWEWNDMMAQDVPKPYWLVEDLLPEGFGVCSSAPKIGKSFLMRQVAYSIATGAPVLGRFEVNQGGVLYIDLEENLTFAQEGWSAIQKKFDIDKYGLPKDLHITLDWPTFDNGGLEEIERFLDINPRVRCVMIDVLSNLWPEAKKIGNIYHQEYKILKPLKDMAEDRHIALVVLHHDHKAESKDPLKKVSGSQAMTGVPDVIWQPFRKRGDSIGRLDVNGRSVREHRISLAWDNWNGGWVAMSDVEEMEY